MSGLSGSEISRIVSRYIGVTGGYLGDFSYRSHAEFYADCDVDANPYEMEGTTRQRFIAILSDADPRDQAKIVRGAVERFPVGGDGAPATRTEKLREELLALAHRLEGAAVTTPSPRITSELVKRALGDAETLLRAQGAASGVDRVHTALHGYLMAACADARIPHAADASATTLFRLLRDQHPAFVVAGPRDQDVTQMIRALATIVDVMNPVRNMASVAHPNPRLLGSAEAMLVINAARTLLHYLDSKLLRER